MSGWRTILAAARAERQAFEAARAGPRAAQLALLDRIIRENADSSFGRAHGFADIASLAAFQAQVPVRGYDEFRPWITRIIAGEDRVLTAAPIVAFEETGGSTSGGKLIPYSEAGLHGFRAAVLPWLAELAARRPAAFAGRAYVAISPACRPPRAIGGIPVGLASDGGYLGADLAASFAAVLAVSPAVARIADVDAWRMATLLALIRARDLSFISVWSPTFLISLVEAIGPHAERLIRALHDGDETAPATAGDPQLARLLARATAGNPVDTQLLWPRLDTISAWTHAAARVPAERLGDLFPHALVQGKGLLATEGAVSVPYGGPWPVPALTSVFLEFTDEAGHCLLCDELREGERYRVAITTASGLYRYDLADCVRCRGHAGGLPLLEFVGRDDITSDLVGEKLCEPFVGEALGELAVPACLAPCPGAPPFYELLVDTGGPAINGAIVAAVEARLRLNPQYAYARRLGQLGPITVRGVPDLFGRYTGILAGRQRRLGDIKPPVLITDRRVHSLLANQVDI